MLDKTAHQGPHVRFEVSFSIFHLNGSTQLFKVQSCPRVPSPSPSTSLLSLWISECSMVGAMSPFEVSKLPCKVLMSPLCPPKRHNSNHMCSCVALLSTTIRENLRRLPISFARHYVCEVRAPIADLRLFASGRCLCAQVHNSVTIAWRMMSAMYKTNQLWLNVFFPSLINLTPVWLFPNLTYRLAMLFCVHATSMFPYRPFKEPKHLQLICVVPTTSDEESHELPMLCFKFKTALACLCSSAVSFVKDWTTVPMFVL